MTESSHHSSTSSSSSSSSSSSFKEEKRTSQDGLTTAAAASVDVDTISAPPAKHPFFERWVQCKVLTRKNYILSVKRNYMQTILQVVTPMVCVVILFFIQLAVDAGYDDLGETPAAVPLPGLAPCIPASGASCVTLLYYPNTNTDVVAIMEQVADRNEPALSYDGNLHSGFEDYELDMWGMPDYESVLNFVVEHENTTYAVVGFNMEFIYSAEGVTRSVNYTESNPGAMGPQISYEIWFNSSLKAVPLSCDEEDFFGREFAANEGIVIVQHAIEQAHLSLQSVLNGGPSVIITASSQAFVEAPAQGSPDEIASFLGNVFFTAAMLVNFMITLVTVTNEKELKLRSGMRMMGLKDSVFWATWLAREAVVLFLAVILLIVFGYIFQFAFFARTNFFVLFFTFYFYGMALTAVAFWITTFVSRVLYAIVIGIAFVIVSVFMALLSPVLSLLFLQTVDIGYRWIFYLLPPFHFIMLYNDIAPATYATYDFAANAMIDGEGFQFGDLYETPFAYRGNTGVRFPLPNEHLYALVLLFFMFLVLTWYCDAVIPNEFGASRHPLFPFDLTYWGCAQGVPSFDVASIEIDDGWDDDVIAEAKGVRDGTLQRVGLRVAGLKKTYGGSCGRRETKAVRGISFGAEYGKVFALLGHNGAGKSTAIGVMTGLHAATDGEVSVFGHTCETEIDAVRRLLGVCPQHDILWAELTAKEHLELFAEFKGVPTSLIQETVMDKLRMVKLDQVANKKSGEFSGGMKRRLSVSIASIGGPKFICLDEPTTGMDPVNRAHVWRMIEELKSDKVVLLTTHSMEEADALGDRIAIMNEGNLACIGTPLHLKAKFGGGYRLTLITHVDSVNIVVGKIKTIVEGVELKDDVAGALNFELPRETSALPALFRWIEDNSKGETPLLKDFGITQTTLEEVFLRLTDRELVVRQTIGTNSAPSGFSHHPSEAGVNMPAMKNDLGEDDYTSNESSSEAN